LKDGYYQVKLVGVEDYEEELSMEKVTDEFYIKEVKLTLGDEDREVTINYGLLFGVGAGFIILALIIIYIMFLSVKKKEEEEGNEYIEDERQYGIRPEGEEGITTPGIETEPTPPDIIQNEKSEGIEE
jgi:hypothetical protein